MQPIHRNDFPRRFQQRTSYGPEIDQQVAELTSLLQSLNGTLTSRSRDRHALQALLGRIDGSMAGLRQAVDAIDAHRASHVETRRTERVFRFDQALFDRSRADRRA